MSLPDRGLLTLPPALSPHRGEGNAWSVSNEQWDSLSVLRLLEKVHKSRTEIAVINGRPDSSSTVRWVHFLAMADMAVSVRPATPFR